MAKRSYGTLTGNTTITVSLSANQDLDLLLTQGGSGSYTVTWSGVTTWLTPSGSAPTLQTTVGAVDLLQFTCVGTTVYGQHSIETGPAGAAGSTGPAGLSWKRTWSSATAYSAGPPADAVYYNGSSYVALQASNSSNPQQPDIAPTYWSALVAGGGTSSGSASTGDDTFTRSNSSNISTNAPFAYTVDFGTVEILSNMLHNTNTSGTHAWIRATGAVPTSADQWCQTTLGAITINGTDNVQWGPTVRSASATATYYEADYKIIGASNWQVRLHSLVAGSDTVIGTYTAGNVPPVAGDTIKLTAVGSTITVYYNGTQRIQVTDTSVDGSTVGGKQCGLHLLRATAAVDVSLSEFKFGV